MPQENLIDAAKRLVELSKQEDGTLAWHEAMEDAYQALIAKIELEEVRRKAGAKRELEILRAAAADKAYQEAYHEENLPNIYKCGDWVPSGDIWERYICWDDEDESESFFRVEFYPGSDRIILARLTG